MPFVEGPYYSDMAVGQVRSVSDMATLLRPGGMAFANSIGTFPGDNIDDKLHKWVEDAAIPGETTLNGAILVGALTVTFTDAVYKVGHRVVIDGEIIVLTNQTAAATFDCTRSAGNIAAAGHDDLANCCLIGNPANEGAAAGDADVIRTPSLPENATQRVEYIVQASDEANKLKRYGQPGRIFDDNVRQQIKLAMIEIQMTQMLGPDSVESVPSTGTVGQCKGLNEFLIDAGNSTNCGGVNMTHSQLRAMAEEIAPYAEDGEDIPLTLLHPLNQGFVFTDWQQAHVEIQPGDPTIEAYGTKAVRRLNIGSVILDCVPMSRLRNAKQSLVYKADYCNSKFFLPLEFKMLAPDGGRDRGMVSANHTIEVRAPQHGWCFYGTP